MRALADLLIQFECLVAGETYVYVAVNRKDGAVSLGAELLFEGEFGLASVLFSAGCNEQCCGQYVKNSFHHFVF